MQSQAGKRQRYYGNLELLRGEKKHVVNTNNSGFQNGIIVICFLTHPCFNLSNEWNRNKNFNTSQVESILVEVVI